MYVSGKFDSWQLMMVVLFLKVLEGTQQHFARGGSPLCDYRRRNEEWRPSIYSRLYNLIVKGDYMSKA